MNHNSNRMDYNIEADTTGRKSRGRISLSVPRGHGTSSGKPDPGPAPPGRIKIGKDHHSRIVALKVCRSLWRLRFLYLGGSCPWCQMGKRSTLEFPYRNGGCLCDGTFDIIQISCAVGSRKSADISQESLGEHNACGEWMDMWYVLVAIAFPKYRVGITTGVEISY